MLYLSENGKICHNGYLMWAHMPFFVAFLNTWKGGYTVWICFQWNRKTHLSTPFDFIASLLFTEEVFHLKTNRLLGALKWSFFGGNAPPLVIILPSLFKRSKTEPRITTQKYESNWAAKRRGGYALCSIKMQACSILVWIKYEKVWI